MTKTPANLPANPAQQAALAVLAQMYEYYEYQAPVRAQALREAA